MFGRLTTAVLIEMKTHDALKLRTDLLSYAQIDFAAEISNQHNPAITAPKIEHSGRV